jgi:hypothetical protein
VHPFGKYINLTNNQGVSIDDRQTYTPSPLRTMTIFLLRHSLESAAGDEGGEWKGAFVLLRGLRAILTWVAEHYQRD